MKVLIAGLGSIGRRHAQILQRLGVTEIIGFDPDSERRDRFAREFGAKTEESFENGLASQPTLTVIASPNRFHIPQALAAARAGSHLLIEKPLGVDEVGVPELIAEVERRRLFAHVGSNWKFHPAFQIMKRLVDDGALGRIIGAQVLWGQWLPDWHPWEDHRRMYSSRKDLGGGVIRDAHEFDYLTWLIGPVVDCTGFSLNTGVLDIETEDIACIGLLHESGALSSLLIDYIQREPRRRYHLSGTEGTLDWDLQAASVTHYAASTRTRQIHDAGDSDINIMYVEQMRHVLDGIATGIEPVTPLAHAGRVLALQVALRRRLGLDDLATP